MESSQDRPASASSAVPSPVPTGVWSAWHRFAFAFLACHWLLFAAPRPLSSLLAIVQQTLGWLDHDCELGIAWKENPWRWLGKWQQELADVYRWWQSATTWCAEHRLAPYEVIHQMTGSGDTGHGWTRVSLITAGALVAATLWTGFWAAVGPRRACPAVWRSLHLLVRWDLALHMFGYGFAKLYATQFGELNPTRLAMEVGDVAPMTMVGTFMKANPGYEVFGGIGEVLGGILLFHPRTALLGAVVTFAVMANVCALNWFCGVPVKLFSAHLLFCALFLMAPWRQRLWCVFVSNRPSAPKTVALTAAAWARWTMLGLGTLLVAAQLVLTFRQYKIPDLSNRQVKAQQEARVKSALYGTWEIESMRLDGAEVSLADAQRWRYFAVEQGTRAWVRSLSGQRQDFEFALSADAQQATLSWTGRSKDAADSWCIDQGTKRVPVWNPVPLRNADRQKPIEAERRTLKVSGTWQGKALEFEAVEKVWKLQTAFRLRQELPDFW